MIKFIYCYIYWLLKRDNLDCNQTAPGAYIQNANVVAWTTWDDVTKVIFH